MEKIKIQKISFCLVQNEIPNMEIELIALNSLKKYTAKISSISEDICVVDKRNEGSIVSIYGFGDFLPTVSKSFKTDFALWIARLGFEEDTVNKLRSAIESCVDEMEGKNYVY